MYDENYDYYSQELRDYTGNLPTNPVKVHPIPNNPFETSMELYPTPIAIPPPPPPMPPPPLDRPKMGSQNQKSGFAQSLKISLFSVLKLHNYVHGSF